MPDDTARPTGVLVVGAARHAHLYPLYFASHPLARVVAVTDVADPPSWAEGGVARLARQLDVPLVASLGEALARPDVDAVCVCTGPRSQPAVARQAAQAGKHLWLDMPFALASSDGRAVVEAVEAAGVTAAVAQRLFAPSVRAARGAIDRGRIGLPWAFQVEFLATWEPEAPFEGALAPAFTEGELLRLGGFPLADVLYLCGREVTTVHAFAGPRFFEAHASARVDDLAVLSLGLDMGGQATIVVGRAPMPGRGMPVDAVIRVRGSKGAVTFREELPAVQVWGNGGPSVWAMDPRWDGRPQAGRLEERLVGDAVDDFLSALRSGHRPALDARQAQAILEILLAARTSAASGEVVRLRGTDLPRRDGRPKAPRNGRTPAANGAVGT